MSVPVASSAVSVRARSPETRGTRGRSSSPPPPHRVGRAAGADARLRAGGEGRLRHRAAAARTARRLGGARRARVQRPGAEQVLDHLLHLAHGAVADAEGPHRASTLGGHRGQPVDRLRDLLVLGGRGRHQQRPGQLVDHDAPAVVAPAAGPCGPRCRRPDGLLQQVRDLAQPEARGAVGPALHALALVHGREDRLPRRDGRRGGHDEHARATRGGHHVAPQLAAAGGLLPLGELLGQRRQPRRVDVAGRDLADGRGAALGVHAGDQLEGHVQARREVGHHEHARRLALGDAAGGLGEHQLQGRRDVPGRGPLERHQHAAEARPHGRGGVGRGQVAEALQPRGLGRLGELDDRERAVVARADGREPLLGERAAGQGPELLVRERPRGPLGRAERQPPLERRLVVADGHAQAAGREVDQPREVQLVGELGLGG